MSKLIAGIDIGGTKCAASVGELSEEGRPRIVGKIRFATPPSPEEAIARLLDGLQGLLGEAGGATPEAVGVSCGGPLDSQRGLILSPPNLPGWDRVDILSPLRERFDAPAYLQNDANACALAEWRWGAGQGCRNLVFLTFGTGMGAGLILDGRLYSGTNDQAGEIGHMRMAPDGPVGYGKAGSLEGFCSGGGIAQLAREMVWQHNGRGLVSELYAAGDDPRLLTAEHVGRAARAGDELAIDILRRSARKLGMAAAVLIDLLNPERIVIGSIYARQQELMEPWVLEAIRREALPLSSSVCQVVPAALGDAVGDYASLSVATLHSDS
ncbi:ROK family protein [Paenibacillus sp. 598K]|uniref:ROK family protein n=1 Tax=Paenibacillus sp. 598K TaxID=1117987 RepID=UPI000FF95DD4|nr:ROK family protein [Paenibacillus sp. 598K]GBF75712.1 ROK family protein [Paenibacillus sp. 598K]